MAFTFLGLSFIAYEVICFILLIAGFKAGTITAGDFVLLLTLNIVIIDNIWPLSIYMMGFSEISGNIIQGLEVMLTPIEIQDKFGAKALQAFKKQ